MHDLVHNDKLLELIKAPSRSMHSYSKSVVKTNPDTSLKLLPDDKDDYHHHYHHYPNTYAKTNSNENNLNSFVLPVINKEINSPMKYNRRNILNQDKEDNENTNSNLITKGTEKEEKNAFRQKNRFSICNPQTSANIFNTQDLVLNSNNDNSTKERLLQSNNDYNRNILYNSNIVRERSKVESYSPNKLRSKLLDDINKRNSLHSFKINYSESPTVKLIGSCQLKRDAANKLSLANANGEDDEEDEDEEVNVMKSYNCLSQAGKNSKGMTKINQDSYLELPRLFHNKEVNLFGVLDGHGVNGHLISQFVANYIKKYFKLDQALQRAKNSKEIYHLLTENNYKKIKNAFTSAEKALLNYPNEIDANFSGTACILVFQIGNRVICANVGDSRAIMIKDRKTILQLSIDHKPELKEEQQRIISYGGEIARENEIGRYRVWIKGKNVPGIAISRSIGDIVASSIGVIPLPEIKEFILDDECKYIIIASDGLWEFMSNERVFKTTRKFYNYNQAESICQTLIEKATKQWEKVDYARDDITVISILL